MDSTVASIRRNAYVDLGLAALALVACGYAWLARGRPVWLVALAALMVLNQIGESTYSLRWTRDPELQKRHGLGWIHLFKATFALLMCGLFAFLSLPLLVIWVLAAAIGFWLPALRWVQWKRRFSAAANSDSSTGLTR